MSGGRGEKQVRGGMKVRGKKENEGRGVNGTGKEGSEAVLRGKFMSSKNSV